MESLFAPADAPVPVPVPKRRAVRRGGSDRAGHRAAVVCALAHATGQLTGAHDVFAPECLRQLSLVRADWEKGQPGYLGAVPVNDARPATTTTAAEGRGGASDTQMEADLPTAPPPPPPRLAMGVLWALCQLVGPFLLRDDLHPNEVSDIHRARGNTLTYAA
jgi:hypothetical protein